MTAPPSKATVHGPAATLIAALLPLDWRDRAVLLEASGRLDENRPNDALDTLLAAWATWRSSGQLPASPLRELVAALATVLGGVGPELRLRPREQNQKGARPLPALGMRPRRRLDGTPFLAATLDQDLTLAAGTELHLVRVRSDDVGTGPTHALTTLPPSVAPTAAALRRAAADRLDGSVLRSDPRDLDLDDACSRRTSP
jgi:hypothetical protein